MPTKFNPLTLSTNENKVKIFIILLPKVSRQGQLLFSLHFINPSPASVLASLLSLVAGNLSSPLSLLQDCCRYFVQI
uniref:Uncharacterized protein n=1 Tax=Salix viminalis TaxID=40686 RepID=A0A6N2KA63_SALVM